MKVSGFTFVRNAVRYDYPVRESILSILPLCDEVVVAVGNSEDDTLGLIRSIPSEKIRIIETVWDDSLRSGGRALAVETDKAFSAVSRDADWALYIQADEVIHEKYHPVIRSAMEDLRSDTRVDGLLFKYLHFYGSYDYVGESSRWYRREIRVVRNRLDIFSYRDAQGFRKRPNDKLRVKLIDAFVYHYGWVKDPRAMQRKQETFHALWHDDEWLDRHVARAEEFDYSGIDALRKFDGQHPVVMQERIRSKNWRFDHDVERKRLSVKERVRRWVEDLTGWRMGEYRNYRLV
jgi:glycosyltransferase involved in cell wall biosynthesis